MSNGILKMKCQHRACVLLMAVKNLLTMKMFPLYIKYKPKPNLLADVCAFCYSIDIQKHQGQTFTVRGTRTFFSHL